MKNIRPVFVMHESGVTKLQMQAVIDGIKEMLQLAGVDGLIEVKNFGDWQYEIYKENGELLPYMSTAWYINQGRLNSLRRDQINSNAIIDCLLTEPWQKQIPHFDVFVLRSDMYSGEEDNNFVIGLALPFLGTVISLFRFLDLDPALQFECIKTENMHEFGHVLGLLPEERTSNVEYSLGKHCANKCVMRQGLTLPDDWIKITRDRLKFGALCEQCLADLQDFFI